MTKEIETQTKPKNVMDEWSPEELKLIQESVARGASDDELRLFLYTANARGLNPLLKQIYFIKRKQRRGDRWVDVGTTQTGIDGFRLIANRTNKLKGIERGLKRDEKGRLYAWARIWRKDWEYPAYEEVSLEEYKGDTALWQRMPEQMLKKCAEVAALRMAFPEDLSGLYAHEEMDQADKTEPVAERALVAPPPRMAEEVASVPALDETTDKQLKEEQKAMKSCLASIKTLQKEYGLSKEEIQWITGLDTFKGVELELLQRATEALKEHCLARSPYQEVS